MAADIKLLASVDTTQVMSALTEIRSQIGMSLASATGFSSAAMSLGGTPNLGGSGFGQTHTNAAMAYSPHYGAVQAHTTMAQEAFVQRGGLAAAHQLAPPGVSDVSYQMAAMSNAIERDINARREAGMAAKEAFYTSAGGMAVGSATGWVGQKIGAGIGAAIGGRFFGSGGAAAGETIGGLVGGFGGYMLGSDAAESVIGGRFAAQRQLEGVSSELGQIIGGGRGLTRVQQYDLGAAAVGAARDLKMDVNEMGDIMALGRQAGMLPTATDPGKAREQIREFARAIDEGAQVLQTSLAGATQVIKTAVQSGMSAQEGVVRAAGAGGADIWLQQQARMSAFANAGASVGMSMGFTPQQGSAMFTGSLGAASQAGLSSAETRIMGGRFGAAQFVGTTQMAMAASPTGDLQLMAAMGGYGGGGDMFSMAGAAMDAMGDGDMISNMVKFQVHKNEYRRGIGASGIRAMSRDQLRMGGEMIQSIAPDISMNEAQRMYAMSMGLNPDQAKTLVGGGRGGGGGGGGGANGMSAREIARSVIATQEQSLSGMGIAAPAVSERRGFTVGRTTAELAATGAIMGKGLLSIPGAAIGAGAGLLIENAGAIKDMVTGGMTKREADAEYDRRVAKAKQDMGYYDINEDDLTNFISKDLSTTNMSFADAGPSSANLQNLSGSNLRRLTGHERISENMIGLLRASGAKRVDPTGANAIEVAPGEAYGIDVVQNMLRAPRWRKNLSQAEEDLTSDAAYYAGTGLAKRNLVQRLGMGEATNAQRDRIYGEKIEQLGHAWKTLASGGNGAYLAGEQLGTLVPDLIASMDISSESGMKRQAELRERWKAGNVTDPVIHQFVEKATGQRLDIVDAAATAGVVGAVGLRGARERLADGRERFLAGTGGLMDRAASTALQRRMDAYEAVKSGRVSKLRQLSPGVNEEYGEYDVGVFLQASASALGDAIEGSRGGISAFNDALVKRTEYKEFRDAVMAGDKDRATQKWQTALRRAGGETNVEVDMEVMGDPYKRVRTHEKEAVVAAAGSQIARGLNFLTGGKNETLEKMQTDLNKEANDLYKKTTSAADEAQIEGRAGGPANATEKRRGRSPLQRAAGFGAKEEAMTSIVRSIRRLEKSVKTTDANVEKTAAKVKEWF